MIWERVFLDSIVLSLIFNSIVGLFWFIIPQSYSRMLPKEIKESAKKYLEKKDIIKLALLLYPLYIFIIIYMIISSKLSNTEGFWNYFWTGYIEMMFIGIVDFLFLDCYLRSRVKDKNMIKGAENCTSWQFKEWMKVAVPEHFVFWPIILCPIVGFLVAIIGNAL